MLHIPTRTSTMSYPTHASIDQCQGTTERVNHIIHPPSNSSNTWMVLDLGSCRCAYYRDHEERHIMRRSWSWGEAYHEAFMIMRKGISCGVHDHVEWHTMRKGISWGSWSWGKAYHEAFMFMHSSPASCIVYTNITLLCIMHTVITNIHIMLTQRDD